MKTYTRKSVLIAVSFVVFLTAGLLTVLVCQCGDQEKQNQQVSIGKTHLNEDDVKEFAWKFLEIYYQNYDKLHFSEDDSKKDLEKFKSFPCEVDFFQKSRTWNVFFTNGLGGLNVEVDNELKTGTILLNANQSSQLFSLHDFKKAVISGDLDDLK